MDPIDKIFATKRGSVAFAVIVARLNKFPVPSDERLVTTDTTFIHRLKRHLKKKFFEGMWIDFPEYRVKMKLEYQKPQYKEEIKDKGLVLLDILKKS